MCPEHDGYLTIDAAQIAEFHALDVGPDVEVDTEAAPNDDVEPLHSGTVGRMAGKCVVSKTLPSQHRSRSQCPTWPNMRRTTFDSV